SHPGIDGIVVVTGAADIARCHRALDGLDKVLAIVAGGSTRQESVCIGLFALGGNEDNLILVHDGARPLVTGDIIDRCLDGARQHGNAVAAVPVADTLKRANADGILTETVERDGLWAVQTPQAFRLGPLFRAEAAARAAGWTGTDESSLVARYGEESVYLALGSGDNGKITRAEDLALAEAILASRQNSAMMQTCVGFGYDIHRFKPQGTLMLGGIEVQDPEGRGLDGHSDADVLLHALCDALLGASGLPDIGVLFPNTDAAYAGIASAELLAEVTRRVRAAGGQIVNVDATLVAESPKIAPYVPQMRAVIADLLGIDVSRVGIKATTNEGLGALGQGQGIAAQAVASVQRPV
ncbi:MAG: 2-C-methyl-D-erythritol 2,4-cyclodiphosphate synthase, partial [Armatimonadota bacterium]|nr:2-C-methyl-D-erythritol 2,4-cyclodiphosphate synthase [Armatimonadota bacterium]